MQLPVVVASFALTSYNLRYVTPVSTPPPPRPRTPTRPQGRGKGARDVLARIDYGGSAALLGAVGALLLFLSYKYNDELAWRAPAVLAPLALAAALAVVFVLVELLVAPEPVLAPFLLRRKAPVLIGVSNFLVSPPRCAAVRAG